MKIGISQNIVYINPPKPSHSINDAIFARSLDHGKSLLAVLGVLSIVKDVNMLSKDLQTVIHFRAHFPPVSLTGSTVTLREMLRLNEPWMEKEEIEAVIDVLKSGILTEKSGMGPRVLEFERAFAKFVGTKHAIAVSSGTAALHAALLAAGISGQDEVVIPSFSFSATAGSVLLAGARPVFADIDPDTYTITLENIEPVLTRNTRAIIPVHLYGLPCDMDPIIEVARQRGIVVIEDAAQAHGAEYNGRKAGSIGELASWSFYGGKNMTTGEGGMITTNDDDLADQLRMIRSQGEQRPYWVTRLGHNYRMPEIEAAIGLAQLRKLPIFLDGRAKNAEYLSEKLSTLGKVIAPKVPPGRTHSWYLYTVRLRGANAGKRNKVVERLRGKNIQAGIYYETPIHLQPFYKERAAMRRGALPESERAARQVFSLPVHPKLTSAEMEYVFETLRRVLI